MGCACEGEHLKLNFSNKTANINDKNLPAVATKYKSDRVIALKQQKLT